MRVHFVIHEPFEAPGAYELWALARGHEVTYTRLYLGDRLPEGPDDRAPQDQGRAPLAQGAAGPGPAASGRVSRGIDLLVVMGGPQSPATTQDECPYFDAASEQRLIRACADTGCLVVGVCLGSQLMGEAFGAPFSHSPEREIGLFPIELTEAGLADPVVAGLGRTLAVGHWHGDMPGVPDGAAVLAKSAGCPRQIVRYAPGCYGFQCHLEFTPESIRDIVAASTDELATYAERPFVQSPEQLLANDYAPMNEALFVLLDRLVASRA